VWAEVIKSGFKGILLVGSKADKANKGFAFYQSKFRRKKHVKNLNPGKNYC
jgi:hypothetical protein